MSERITIDLDKIAVPHENPALASILYSQIREIVKKAAVPDSPTPPPDDRLDVIFEFATLLSWEPVRDHCEVSVTWKLDGEIIKRTLNVEYIRSSDAGASAAAYCWRRGWFINHFADHHTHLEVFLPVGKDNSERVVRLDKRKYANDHEALVRAVLAAARAEKKPLP